MRLIIHPTAQPDDKLDSTNRLTAAIAQELWLRYGGNETINWVEAERHLQAIVDDARSNANRVPPHRPRLAVRARGGG